MRNLGLFLFLSACTASFGQTISVTEHEVPTKPSSLIIDGVFAAGEWDEALSLDLPWEVKPGYNSQAPLATEGYIFKDNQALYVGFRCKYDPSDFRANLNRRDAAWEDDFVGIALDVYGDTRNMVFLGSNAYGVQLDVRKNDPANEMDNEFDMSYDVEFIAQAARSEENTLWSSEFHSTPFSLAAVLDNAGSSPSFDRPIPKACRSTRRPTPCTAKLFAPTASMRTFSF